AVDGVTLAHEGQEHTDTEIEALQDEVADPQDRDGDEPDDCQFHGRDSPSVTEVRDLGLVLVVLQIGDDLRGTCLDVLPEQTDLDDEQHPVHGGEERKAHRDRPEIDPGRHARGGEQFTVHGPGLAAHLGEDPPEDVGRQGRGQGEYRGVVEPPGAGQTLLVPRQVETDHGDGDTEQAKAHHEPEGPVDDEHVGDVVTGAVVLLVGLLEVVHPVDLTVEVPGGKEAEHVGDGDVDGVVALVDVTDGERGEGGTLLGLPQGFGGGELHGFVLGGEFGLVVPGEDGEGPGDEGDDQADAERAVEQGTFTRGWGHPGLSGVVVVYVAPELVGADRDHEQPGGHERGRDRVHVRGPGLVVAEHGPDVVEFGASGLLVDVVADRVTHPGVGREDEVRGQV